jgi:hypothetical protein
MDALAVMVKNPLSIIVDPVSERYLLLKKNLYPTARHKQAWKTVQVMSKKVVFMLLFETTVNGMAPMALDIKIIGVKMSLMLSCADINLNHPMSEH